MERLGREKETGRSIDKADRSQGSQSQRSVAPAPRSQRPASRQRSQSQSTGQAVAKTRASQLKSWNSEDFLRFPQDFLRILLGLY